MSNASFPALNRPRWYLQTPGLRRTGRWVFLLVLFVFAVPALYVAAAMWGAGGSSDDSAVVGGGSAIIVLGGGLEASGAPPSWQKERCHVAAKLYHEAISSSSSSSSAAVPPPPRIIALSGGTPWKPPPRDARGFPVTEAAASVLYLGKEMEPAALRVPFEHLMEEAFSLDTIGNAYFLRAMHTDPARIRRLSVITNAFHMPRARAIFEWVFSLPLAVGPSGAVAAGDQIPHAPYTLTFYTAENAGMSAETVALRSDKEAASLRNLPKTASRVRSMQELHRFVFDEHGAYGAFRHATDRSAEVIDPAVLSTY